MSPTAMPFVPPDLAPDQLFACTSDLRINELQPGETARVAAVWHGLAGDGTPAPAGLYHVKLTFPFLARQDAAPFTGDAFADQHPITLDAGFEVSGEPWSGLTSDQAIDRALADARVKSWIADSLPRTRVGGARIRLTDQGSWRFEIDRQTPDGMDTEIATIEIDPTTGQVTPVTLPPA
jgi:peptidase YpeB-like protein